LALTTVLISLAVMVLTFVSGIVGLLLQRLLPEPHTSDRSRDMIDAVVGLVTLMLALVLGTIIGFTYGAFTVQKTEIETLSARYLQLDHALARYGPETQAARAHLKDTLTRSYDLFFAGGDADPNKLTVVASEADVWAVDDYLASLDPKTPAQKEQLATASSNASQIEQTRLLMSLQLAAGPVPYSLMIVVVVWSSLLFCGFGVLSRINPTTLVVLALGAFAVASGIYLILDLSAPYTACSACPRRDSNRQSRRWTIARRVANAPAKGRPKLAIDSPPSRSIKSSVFAATKGMTRRRRERLENGTF
jgi:hypothetical protein